MGLASPLVVPDSGSCPRMGVVARDDATWRRIVEALEPAELILVRAARLADLGGAQVDLVLLQSDGSAEDELRYLSGKRGGGGPALTVVLICQTLDPRRLRRSLDAGIVGIVLADEIAQALGPTVAATLVGQVAIPRSLGQGLRRRPLSFREKQILGLAVLGYTNSQIGRRLYLAESTVKSHLSSSFDKLGVSSRSEAAAVISDTTDPIGIEINRIAAKIDQPVASCA